MLNDQEYIKAVKYALAWRNGISEDDVIVEILGCDKEGCRKIRVTYPHIFEGVSWDTLVKKFHAILSESFQ